MFCKFLLYTNTVLFLFLPFCAETFAGDVSVELETLYWFGSTDRDEVKYTLHNFGGGSVKMQKELGVSSDKSTPVVKLALNLSADSRLRFTAWSLERDGEGVVDRRVGFDDSVFVHGTTVLSQFRYFTLRAEYDYDIAHYENKWLKDLYVTSGLEYVSLFGSVTDAAIGQDDKMDSGSLAPLLGFGIDGEITENLKYRFAFSGIAYKWDSTKNTNHFHQVVSNFILGLKYESGRFGFSTGYEYFSFVVGNEMDPDQEREFHVFNGGPFVGFSINF
ncbi:MAG: hypothetical protein HZA48_04445 [Planctomycetes bacterium]|nr:hypothetical protein [Planctomycetota bacterium]